MTSLVVILQQLYESEVEREVEKVSSILSVTPSLWPHEKDSRHHNCEVLMHQPPRHDATPVRPQNVFTQSRRAIVPHQQKMIKRVCDSVQQNRKCGQKVGHVIKNVRHQ